MDTYVREEIIVKECDNCQELKKIVFDLECRIEELEDQLDAYESEPPYDWRGDLD